MFCLKKQEYLVHIFFYSQASGLIYIERRNKPDVLPIAISEYPLKDSGVLSH